ncbi:MAG: hypothetical protein ABIJ45_06265 [Candidatus Zixiibacteriota bacterium]
MAQDDKSFDALAQMLEKILGSEEVIGKIAEKVAEKMGGRVASKRMTTGQFWKNKVKEAGFELDEECTDERIAKHFPLSGPEIERVVNRIHKSMPKTPVKLVDIQKLAAEQLGEDILLERTAAIKTGQTRRVAPQDLTQKYPCIPDYGCSKPFYIGCQWIPDYNCRLMPDYICNWYPDVPDCRFVPDYICNWLPDFPDCRFISDFCSKLDVCRAKEDVCLPYRFSEPCNPFDACSVIDYGGCSAPFFDPECGIRDTCASWFNDPCPGFFDQGCAGFYDPGRFIDPREQYQFMERYRRMARYRNLGRYGASSRQYRRR